MATSFFSTPSVVMRTSLKHSTDKFPLLFLLHPQEKFFSSIWFSTSFWRLSSWAYGSFSQRRSLRAVLSTSWRKASSVTIPDWVSDQCRQSRMLRALWSGMKRTTQRIRNTGSRKSTRSWMVRWIILPSFEYFLSQLTNCRVQAKNQ